MTSVRVLHVFKTYFPETQGGLEEVIRQICRYTHPLGVQTRVLTLSADSLPETISLPETEVVRCPRQWDVASCGLSWPFFRAFRRQANWADIIHYHFPWPLADVAHILMAPRKPSLITYHADIVRQQGLLRLYRPIMHRFLGQLDTIVATSSNYAHTSPVLQRFAHKVKVIPIGLGEGQPPEPDPDRVSALRQRVGEGFFLFVGVLRYYKGLHHLLEAIAPHHVDAGSSQGAESLPLVIAGSGPMERALREQAKQLGLAHIHFLGQVSDADKTALLQLCRGVVFPSHLRAEAFGLTLLEGAMHGKPLISTEIGTGTSFVNRHCETGFVVPPNDPAALRRFMLILHRDPAMAATLGQAAQRRYLDLFTAPRMADAYERLYRQLLSADKP
ncbi:glycosyltransferase [Ectothiorhodospira variabilis]|uniref:glycosyltransferase n=1 Tax=Ectothiorhodospira variabilis TaxID=505694 RepID=UPI001EFBCB05|nr:glycosyltransferase [Ectothiorhodospira variabilis]MCG5496572.1 glycosyltransferase [Ectothiorhodospira variabilis]